MPTMFGMTIVGNIATGETSPAITPYHTYHFSQPCRCSTPWTRQCLICPALQQPASNLHHLHDTTPPNADPLDGSTETSSKDQAPSLSDSFTSGDYEDMTAANQYCYWKYEMVVWLPLMGKERLNAIAKCFSFLQSKFLSSLLILSPFSTSFSFTDVQFRCW